MMVAMLLAACTDEPTDRILCNQHWPFADGTTVSVQYCARACQTPPTYEEGEAARCTWQDEIGRTRNFLFSFVEPTSGQRGVCWFKAPYGDLSSAEIVFHTCEEQ